MVAKANKLKPDDYDTIVHLGNTYFDAADTDPTKFPDAEKWYAQALAKKMAAAWVNFARKGNPSQPGLTWTPSDATRCQTMVFDNDCRMVDDPDGQLRRILLS